MIDKGGADWSVLQRKEFWQLLSSWICLLGCLTTLLGCSAAAILLLLLLYCNTGWAVQWVQCSSRAAAGSASSKPAWSAFILRTATTVDMKISFTDLNVVHSTFQTYSKLRNSPTQIDFRFQYLVEHIKETVFFSSTTLGAATVKPRNIVQYL